MTKSLCLHVGDCKTGSTSIQTVLQTGAFKSPERSVLYPVEKGRLHHCALAATLYKPRMKPRRKTAFKALSQQLNASDADVVIVSGEWFEYADPELLDRVLRRRLPRYAETTRIIAYVRPHAERLVSSYQERAKLGHAVGSLKAFHATSRAKGLFEYAPRLRRWREGFGDRYTVRPMVRSRLAGGDVVKDFLDLALEGAPVTVGETTSVNTSLGVRDLALVLAMHRGGKLPSQAVRHLSWALQELSGEGDMGGGERLRLDRALLAEVRADYLDDARACDEEFFGGDDFQRAFDRAAATAVDAPQVIAPEKVLTPQELRRCAAVARALREMARELWHARARIAELEAAAGLDRDEDDDDDETQAEDAAAASRRPALLRRFA